MPYTEEQFSAADVREAFKKAVASATGTVPENVEIVSMQQARRRTSSVVVKTKIPAKDAAALATMTSTLSSGGALKTKMDAALSKQGLKGVEKRHTASNRHFRRGSLRGLDGKSARLCSGPHCRCAHVQCQVK